MTLTAADRTRLSDVRERLADLRRQRTRAADHRDAATQALRSIQGNGVSAADLVNTPEFRRSEAALKDCHDIEAKIASTEAEERYLLSRVAGVDTIHRESFLTDVNVLEEFRQLSTSSQPVGNVNLGPLMSRDELLAHFERQRQEVIGFGGSRMAAAGDVTIGDGSRVGPYYGVVPQLRRRLRILDLIPSSPMDGKSFDFTIEAGSLDTAAEVAEAGMKPTGEATLDDGTVVAKTVAHWVKVPRQQLSDVPELTGTLNQRLLYGVQRRLEAQIIGGDGVGENLTGIVNTSGIGAPASVAGDDLNADLIVNGITSVLLSEADPDAVCLNPADWQKIAKSKASGSGERMRDIQVDAAGNMTLFGVALIPSTAIAAGHALVGDFSLGARLYVREGVNVRLSDSDQDDFVRNRVTFLGEGRFGVAVFQPTAFAYVSLTFSN